MDTPNTPQISDTDRKINAAIRRILDHTGETAQALGRRLDIPAASWARKISNRPGYHQRWTADEVARIARAIGVTPNDLYSGAPNLW